MTRPTAGPCRALRSCARVLKRKGVGPFRSPLPPAGRPPLRSTCGPVTAAWKGGTILHTPLREASPWMLRM